MSVDSKIGERARSIIKRMVVINFSDISRRSTAVDWENKKLGVLHTKNRFEECERKAKCFCRQMKTEK